MRANFSNLDNSSLAVTKALSPIIGIVTLRDGTLGVPEIAEMVVVGWGTRGCGEAGLVTNSMIFSHLFTIKIIVKKCDFYYCCLS